MLSAGGHLSDIQGMPSKNVTVLQSINTAEMLLHLRMLQLRQYLYFFFKLVSNWKLNPTTYSVTRLLTSLVTSFLVLVASDPRKS